MTEVAFETAFYNTTSIRPLFSQNIQDSSANIGGQEIEDEERNLTESIAASCNKSVYFMCPETNPLFNTCVSITLNSEIKVNIRITSILINTLLLLYNMVNLDIIR